MKYFKKIYLIIFLIFISATLSFSFEKVKFAVVADPHLSMPAEGVVDAFKMGLHSVELLDSTIAALNRIPDLDFVLFCGDLTQDAEPWNLDMFVYLISKLKVPTYCVLGNHDLSPVPKPRKFPGPPPARGVPRATFVWALQGHGFKGSTPWWSVDPVPGLHIIGLDTNKPGDWGGTIPDAELKWLEQDIFANRDKLTIVISHHNFVPWSKDEESSEWKDYNKFVADNADVVRKIFEKYPNVSFVLTGHRHISTRYKKVNGVYYIVNPSTCTYPMRYVVYELTPEYLKYTTYNVPCSKEVWETAKKNCIGKPGEWWRLSTHPHTPEGDKAMLKFFESPETMTATLPVRFKAKVKAY